MSMNTLNSTLPHNDVYSCTDMQFKTLISTNKYVSLSKVKTLDLPRRAKRILRLMKYKAFGVVMSTSKTRYKVQYSEPSPCAYEVKPLGIISEVKEKIDIPITKPPTADDFCDFEPFEKIVKAHNLGDLQGKPRDKLKLKVSCDFQYFVQACILGKTPGVKTENGVQVALSSPEDYVKRFWPGIEPCIITEGLQGGGRNGRNKSKRQRKRPKRQGPRRPITTNAMRTTSNLNVPRSLPPQYAPNVWSYISSVSSDASGRFSFYVNIRNPAKAINGSGQFTRAVEDAKIWDGYYIRNYVLQMVPIIPMTVTAGAIIAAVDQEGTAPVSTPTYDNLVDRRYRSMFNGRQTKTINIRPKPLTSGTFEGRVCPITQSGRKLFYDYEFPPDQGIIEVAGEGFPASSAIAQIFLWMEVVNYSPRTLPGTAPPRYNAKTENGAPVLNPAPVLPLRPRARSM